MAITLKEIARLANVSPSSVSLVLNNKPNRISKQTRDLILKIAEEHQYRPNAAARSLVTKQTQTLGLIIPDIDNIFFSKLAKILETEVRKDGYTLIIVNTNDNYEEDLLLIDLLISRGVDGLFISISNEAYLYHDTLWNTLKSLPIPYVMMDRVVDYYECNKVYYDNISGAYEATKYLIEQGHSKIACICNTYLSNNSIARINGYKKAMDEYGLKIPKEYVIPANFRIEGGYQAGEQILKTDCTAIFSSNDMMTLGVLKKFNEVGVKVPNDYMIVSYDNLLSDYVFGINISSVDQDINELGLKSWEIMKEALAKENMEPKTICLDTKLIIR
jgi:LacI family transcriptional regulator